MALVLSGCDSAGSQSTEFKPVESNILKKLGKASQEQNDAAKEKVADRVKKKK
jgi:hypothetical protein